MDVSVFFHISNFQEGELCQKYTNTYFSFSKHLEFSQWMSFRCEFQGNDTKRSINNIRDIYHFEEIMHKLFQERSNIDASLAALLEFYVLRMDSS